ncbi:MAG: hypothetical protein O2960_23470 [Verrucomicrobia bacterium]|nr:hypothetical protein [Verrucomicrobiota bacterium]
MSSVPVTFAGGTSDCFGSRNEARDERSIRHPDYWPAKWILKYHLSLGFPQLKLPAAPLNDRFDSPVDDICAALMVRLHRTVASLFVTDCGLSRSAEGRPGQGCRDRTDAVNL